MPWPVGDHVEQVPSSTFDDLGEERRVVGLPSAGRRKVDRVIAAGHAGANRLDVANVTVHSHVSDSGEAARVAPEAKQAHDLVSQRGERPDDHRADEPVAAGDKDAHGRGIRERSIHQAGQRVDHAVDLLGRVVRVHDEA